VTASGHPVLGGAIPGDDPTIDLPSTLYTFIGSLTPLTVVGPNDLKAKYPSHSPCVRCVAAIDPIGARACIRAARPVEWPIGVYSA
jgi:hypothetical protein